jgi:hypothetical protein
MAGSAMRAALIKNDLERMTGTFRKLVSRLLAGTTRRCRVCPATPLPCPPRLFGRGDLGRRLCVPPFQVVCPFQAVDIYREKQIECQVKENPFFA